MVVTATSTSPAAGADIILEGSADGTNWYTISSNNVDTDGTTKYHDNNLHKYVRATVASRLDGTFTVRLILGGHAGSGGWSDN
jgi:hypothetical protein